MRFFFEPEVPVIEQLRAMTLEKARSLLHFFKFDHSKLPHAARAVLRAHLEDVYQETDFKWLEALREAESRAKEFGEVSEEIVLKLAERILCDQKYLPPHFDRVFICSDCGPSGRSEFYEKRGECPFCFAQEQWSDDNAHLRGMGKDGSPLDAPYIFTKGRKTK